MDNQRALDPQNSVVVEACAGSGKTWLLVSRIVRLLLDEVQPGEILAITFTRKAAQEMQERLRDWLYDLATKDDDFVRQFLRERAISEAELDVVLPKARGLYQQFLTAQPALTINTFHGWFMQIVKRAPLDAGMAGGVQLVEQTGALWDEANDLFFSRLQQQPDSEIAQSMNFLFAEIGLHNTQKLLSAFAGKRSEWWAYTAGQEAPLDYVLQALRDELRVDLASDPLADFCADNSALITLQNFAQQLASNGTTSQCENANKLILATEIEDAQTRFNALCKFFLTDKLQPRKTFNATAKQKSNEAAFDLARDNAIALIQQVLAQLQAQKIYVFNEHALRCGVAMLDSYQRLKQQQQSLDFSDLEWRVCQLLNHSAHAEYLQYKLDSHYRHVLLDEFQDTNPLQWQILQAWFAASKAVESDPKIFVVGDPKQSIYRFRRADARLFNVVCEFLQTQYRAVYLSQNKTRRNAPAILAAVNAVFDGLADGKPKFAGFETHSAYQTELPGHVEVLPLAQVEVAEKSDANSTVLSLRNPLLQAYPDREEGARELEAAQFADKLLSIVGQWRILDGGVERAVQWRDIMVLVRRRTYLKIYEQALRERHIPYLTSRRGGLLDTLEASDIQALLTFLMTPFADLQLAQVLRSPLFSCGDEELMQIAQARDEQKNWWSRLQSLVASGTASAPLQRAHKLLSDWLLWAEKLPVHDLLDRIYFAADVQSRYAAAVPLAMRATVLANLQAFMEIALNVDAGRYPSLSRFLRTLAELKQADDNEAPNEGAVDQAGDALRIYTVHESKGLESPLVWLLDSNAKAPSDKGFEVLIDWPTGAQQPAHFSLYADQASHGAAREKYFAAEKLLAEREDMNLLYVAMTRAKQVLMVSGSGALIENSWYDRVENASSTAAQVELTLPSPFNPDCPLRIKTTEFVGATSAANKNNRGQVRSYKGDFPNGQSGLKGNEAPDPRLTQPLPTGKRKPVTTEPQRRGIWLHSLLQHLASTPSLLAGASGVGENSLSKDALQHRLNIPADVIDELWQHAQHLLSAPALARFFDPQQYRSASNEMPYVNARGELKRIDRLVEFDDEVWVLDYKLSDDTDASRHQVQMDEYRAAMQSVYAEKTVRCALLFADGTMVQA